MGGRLVLTAQGEQLLGDCRELLAHATAIRERAQSLRDEDSGILKIAAAPGFIEGVLADFLCIYAQRYPKVQVKLVEAFGPQMLGMLERGDINLGQFLMHGSGLDSRQFGSHMLEPLNILAASHPKLSLGSARAIEIGQLSPYQLVLLDDNFLFRQIFDAACRLAELKPNILFESHDPRTLIAMAEAGHGVAIIPSVLRTQNRALRIVALTFRGKPLQVPTAILWDARRPRPRYAAEFCEMLAKYVRKVFSDHAPLKSEGQLEAGKQPDVKLASVIY